MKKLITIEGRKVHVLIFTERYNSELRFGKEKMIMSAVIVSFDLS